MMTTLVILVGLLVVLLTLTMATFAAMTWKYRKDEPSWFNAVSVVILTGGTFSAGVSWFYFFTQLLPDVL